jgi:hypothetical protein
MNSAAALHPSPDDLRRLVNGLLGADEAASIEEHVSTCRECCDSLRRVPEDSFIALVRRATSSPSPWASGDTTLPILSGQPGGNCADSTCPDGDPAPPAIDNLPAELAEHPNYRVLELLGHGGMGTVYKAKHRLMKRTVALKLLAPNLTKYPELVERFVREIQTGARLKHPNIGHSSLIPTPGQPPESRNPKGD